MITSAESDLSCRQIRFPGSGAAGRSSIDSDMGFSLRDTLAHTEVRELSFAEFRAAMEQMRHTGS